LEEIMHKQTARNTITASLAAFALGAAIVSAPALAQSRNANDGGPVKEPTAGQIAASKAQSKAATQQKAAYYGRNANDGGVLPEPSTTDKTAGALSQTAQKPATPHLGRSANDGGLTDNQ
jgi:hypothetical protein